MNFKEKLIERHKNPLGLTLRVSTYLLLGYALWHHSLKLALACFILDLINWFFMPMVTPTWESPLINRIVEKEIAWLRSPVNRTKVLSISTGIVLLILLVIGLWNHSYVMLLAALICLVILKQLLLRATHPMTSNYD